MGAQCRQQHAHSGKLAIRLRYLKTERDALQRDVPRLLKRAKRTTRASRPSTCGGESAKKRGWTSERSRYVLTRSRAVSACRRGLTSSCSSAIDMGGDRCPRRSSRMSSRRYWQMCQTPEQPQVARSCSAGTGWMRTRCRPSMCCSHERSTFRIPLSQPNVKRRRTRNPPLGA